MTTPWVMSHDLIQANEEETVRATRHAHHRWHTYRRPGRFLASLLQPWMGRVLIPRHANRAPLDLTPMALDSLYVTVLDLGSGADAGGAPDAPVQPGPIA